MGRDEIDQISGELEGMLHMTSKRQLDMEFQEVPMDPPPKQIPGPPSQALKEAGQKDLDGEERPLEQEPGQEIREGSRQELGQEPRREPRQEPRAGRKEGLREGLGEGPKAGPREGRLEEGPCQENQAGSAKAQERWARREKRTGREGKTAPPQSLIRPSDALVAAFFVPVIIMVIIFIQRGIFPFGEESFLRTDMYHQYAPFFSEFRHKLTQGGSLLYSWDVGMGVNFAALYAYYLASPLNWLVALCPQNLVIEFMTYMIVVKIGLSGLSFAWYLRKHCGTRDFGVAFFGIFYALSGYMAAYSWNIMWLDCIILFPLITLGLERLVKEKKWKLYCITLGLSILSNYYISIMICIFMVLYFVALLILEKKKPLKEYLVNVFQFSIFSLAAGGLAAVVLLPEIYALQATASGNFNFPKTFTSYFSIFDMIARHLGNVQTETGLDHWPNIYCGVAVLMFFLLYLGCRKISVKEKAVYCGLLLIFYASFSIDVLDFIWHGFHYPNSLPSRQSFIYIGLMLLICYRAYCHLKSMPWKHVALGFWGSVCFVLLAQKLVSGKDYHFIVFYVALLFLSIYAGLAYLYKKGVNRNLMILLALGIVSVEAAVNTTVTSVTTTSRASYVRDNGDVRKLTENLRDYSPFYRIDKLDGKTKNDGAWMNFPSASLFSSTANADLTKFVKKLGCESSTNAYSIIGSTPLVDSLFSIKYTLSPKLMPDGQLHSLLNQEGQTKLYENKDILPVGFMLPQNLEKDWRTDLGNPADVQNDLARLVGAGPVLEEAEGQVDGTAFRFTPREAGEYYVYVNNKKIEKVTATIDGNYQSFENVSRGYLLKLGYVQAGEQVTLKSDEGSQDLVATAYRFLPEGLQAVYDALNANPLEVTTWKDAEIKGVVKAGQAGLLYTSIPYDKGWTVEVDEEKRTTRKVFDTFLAVDLPQGTHTITLKYQPQGLALGGLVTGGSLVFLLLAAGVQWLVDRKKEERDFIETR